MHIKTEQNTWSHSLLLCLRDMKLHFIKYNQSKQQKEKIFKAVYVHWKHTYKIYICVN